MGSLRQLLRSVSSGPVVAYALLSVGCQSELPAPGPQEALAEQVQAIAGGIADVNAPVVGFEYRDWDVLPPEGFEYYRCSGTLINEHWILTASHCVPRFEDELVPDSDRPAEQLDKQRSFPAYIYQTFEDRVGGKVELKTTAITAPSMRGKCSGPRSRAEVAKQARDPDCALRVTAFPFKKRDVNCKGKGCSRYFDPAVLAADDVALLFINELYPISTNQDSSGAAIEPELGALPLAFGHGAQLNEPLVPWGWGYQNREQVRDDGYRMALRSPDGGRFLRATFDSEIAEEKIELTAGNEPNAVKVCKGDSGGPLLATRDGKQTIVGVASAITFNDGACPQGGGAMRWARVDTKEKRDWIQEVVQNDCRDVGSRSECWQPRCDTKKCDEGTCRNRSRNSMTKQHELPDTIHVDRCVPKRKKK